MFKELNQSVGELFNNFARTKHQKISNTTIQNFIVSTSHQMYFGEDLVAEVPTSEERSKIIDAKELGKSNVVGRRIKVKTALSEQKAKEMNLEILIPATLELNLEFLPKCLPQGIRKLTMRVSLKGASGFIGIFPPGLEFLRLKINSLEPREESSIVVGEICKLPRLKTLEIHFSYISPLSLKTIVRFALEANLRFLMISEKVNVMRWFETCTTRYDGTSHILHQAYRRALAQTHCIFKCNKLRHLCSSSIDQMLELLAADVI